MALLAFNLIRSAYAGQIIYPTLTCTEYLTADSIAEKNAAYFSTNHASDFVIWNDKVQIHSYADNSGWPSQSVTSGRAKIRHLEFHRHSAAEFYLIREGRAEVRLGDGKIVAEPGMYLYLPGNIPHEVIALDGKPVILDYFFPRGSLQDVHYDHEPVLPWTGEPAVVGRLPSADEETGFPYALLLNGTTDLPDTRMVLNMISVSTGKEFRHTAIENAMYVVTAGYGRAQIGGQKVRLEPNTFFYLPKNERIKFLGPSEGPNNLQIIEYHLVHGR